MKEISQDNLIYIKIKDVAIYTGVSKRTLKDRCSKNKYTCRLINGNGGKQYEILLTSLEPEIQEKIITNLKSSDETWDVVDYEGSLSQRGMTQQAPVFLENQKANDISNIILQSAAMLPTSQNCTRLSLVENSPVPEKAKKIALAKMDLLNHWEAFRTGKNDKKQADKDFITMYNSKILSLNLFNTIGKISVASLYRWKKDLKDNNNDYRALIPNYSYGSESQINTKMSEIEQKYLLDLMLSPSKINVGNAHRIIKFVLQKQGIEEMASYPTYKRFVQKFKRNKYDIWVLMREGQKALIDKVAPHIVRDISKLEVGDVLIADGHKLDFMIQHPFTGKPCRATIVVYQDWKSCDIAGYEIMVTENTQCIAAALRNSVIRLGKTPKIAYQDNGAAFRGKFFTGSESLEDSGFYGLFGALGIVPVFAKPYNGKAKAVERFFREFSQTFSSLVTSYVGNNIANKPAYLMRNEKFHKKIHSDFVPTIEETVLAFEKWLEFYRSQPCPHVENLTIGEVFNNGRGAGIDIDRLDDLMMAQEQRTIVRNGIKMFNTFYYSDELYGLKDTVIVKYSLLDISQVKVYSLSGEYICTAKTVMEVHPMAEYLGDNTDVYNFKQALKQNKLAITKTMKEAKNIVPRLQKRVDWQKPLQIEKKIMPKENEPPLVIDRYENLITIDREADYEINFDKLLPQIKQANS